MISLKKYLDMDVSGLLIEEPEIDGSFAAAMECYRNLLGAIGKTAVQISPAFGADLELNLHRLEHRVSIQPSPESVRHIEKQVEIQMQEWGGRLSQHLKAKADEVREILVALAKTAESVGSRDQGYAVRFREVTDRLAGIANLDDLTQIRASLVKQASDLKNSVDQMTRDSKELVAHLRAEVSIYETKLKTAEQLSLRDELTRVANRRSVEERIRWCIECNQTFCFVMLDLNEFKQVNDLHGHQVGDQYLQEVSRRMKRQLRPCDVLARLGGDEFAVLVSEVRNRAEVEEITSRLQACFLDPFVGDGYFLHGSASFGVSIYPEDADSADSLLRGADAAMYVAKYTRLANSRVSEDQPESEQIGRAHV